METQINFLSIQSQESSYPGCLLRANESQRTVAGCCNPDWGMFLQLFVLAAFFTSQRRNRKMTILGKYDAAWGLDLIAKRQECRGCVDVLIFTCNL